MKNIATMLCPACCFRNGYNCSLVGENNIFFKTLVAEKMYTLWAKSTDLSFSLFSWFLLFRLISSWNVNWFHTFFLVIYAVSLLLLFFFYYRFIGWCLDLLLTGDLLQYPNHLFFTLDSSQGTWMRTIWRKYLVMHSLITICICFVVKFIVNLGSIKFPNF